MDAGRAGPPLTVHEDAGGRRHFVVGGRTFLVYQVYYDERSAGRVDPRYTPHRSPRVGPFFESAIIAELLGAGAHRAADYFGVFSWKFAAKIPLDARAIAERIGRGDEGADAYSFFGRVADRRLWAVAEPKHPGILAAAGLLLQRLGLDVDLERLQAPIVYQNHFLCRSPLYERFGRELLEPALAAMADPADERLQSLLLRDAGYRDPRLSPAQLVAIFGRPHFCLHPFIAERLFSTWLALNPGVRLHQLWRGRFVERKDVPYEPEMRRRPRR